MSEQENAITNPVEEKTCCICERSREIAHEVHFHYGKKTVSGKTSKVDPASHKVSGVYEGYVCSKCFGRTQRLPIFAGIFSILAVLSGSVYLTITFGLGGYPLALSVLYLIIGYGIYQSNKLIKKFKAGNLDKMVYDEASKLLIKEKGPELYQQGFDTFWTPDEFDFMERRKNPPAPAGTESL